MQAQKKYLFLYFFAVCPCAFTDFTSYSVKPDRKLSCSVSRQSTCSSLCNHNYTVVIITKSVAASALASPHVTPPQRDDKYIIQQ